MSDVASRLCAHVTRRYYPPTQPQPNPPVHSVAWCVSAKMCTPTLSVFGLPAYTCTSTYAHLHLHTRIHVQIRIRILSIYVYYVYMYIYIWNYLWAYIFHMYIYIYIYIYLLPMNVSIKCYLFEMNWKHATCWKGMHSVSFRDTALVEQTKEVSFVNQICAMEKHYFPGCMKSTWSSIASVCEMVIALCLKRNLKGYIQWWCFLTFVYVIIRSFWKGKDRHDMKPLLWEQWVSTCPRKNN